LNLGARKHQTIRVLHDLAAIVICLIFLGPVLWAIYSAFRPSRDLFVFPPNISLTGFSLQNFRAVFVSGDVTRYALNSLLVAATSSVITILASSMAGFALAKFKFPGRNLIFMTILATLLIPIQVLMVLVFLVLKTLGWVNQLIGIIVRRLLHRPVRS
jgi:alpha-1,4-digalacturonate transport system permease protein